MQENVIVKLAEHYGVAERIIGPHVWNQANGWAVEMNVADATLLHDGEHQDEFLFQHDARHEQPALDHPTNYPTKTATAGQTDVATTQLAPATTNYPTGPLPTIVVAHNDQKES